jgi:hypothetical protein
MSSLRAFRVLWTPEVAAGQDDQREAVATVAEAAL